MMFMAAKPATCQAARETAGPRSLLLLGAHRHKRMAVITAIFEPRRIAAAQQPRDQDTVQPAVREVQPRSVTPERFDRMLDAADASAACNPSTASSMPMRAVCHRLGIERKVRLSVMARSWRIQHHPAARAENARIILVKVHNQLPLAGLRACHAVKAATGRIVERDQMVAPLIGRMRKPRLRSETASRECLWDHALKCRGPYCRHHHAQSLPLTANAARPAVLPGRRPARTSIRLCMNSWSVRPRMWTSPLSPSPRLTAKTIPKNPNEADQNMLAGQFAWHVWRRIFKSSPGPKK
jgi:hypothetical protein